MLYKVKGIKHKPGIRFKQLNGNMSQEVIQERRIYYVEATSFQKATAKAKKLVDHIHEISQVQGEIADC